MAFVCSASFAQAQAPASVKAAVRSEEVQGGRLSDISVVGGDRNALIYRIGVQDITLPFDKIKGYMMVTPNEYITAMEFFQDGRYRQARSMFADYRNKYRNIENLPANYAAECAYMEVECAVRMLDWPSVKALTPKLPRGNVVSRSTGSNFDVYQLLGSLADNQPDGVIKTATDLLQNKNKLGLEQVARVYYALGASQAAKAGDDTKAQETALNNLAKAMIMQHGGGMELAGSAVKLSMDVLAMDPSIGEYMKNAPSELTPKIRLAAPKKVQELAALAYFHTKVLYPNASMPKKYSKFIDYYLSAGEREALRKSVSEEDAAEAEKKASEKSAAADEAKSEEQKPEENQESAPAE